MKHNFKKCLEVILHHEGGYVDHPKDPGGATKYGVTIYTAKALKLDVDKDGDVDKNDVKLFTPEIVEPVYKRNYWDKVNCDNLPEGLDLCVFDFAVNAGTRRSAKYLQAMVGAYKDGAIGPKTLEKVNEFVETHGLESSIKTFQDMRLRYYQRLRTFKTFGRGWTRRVKETTEEALGMV